MIYKEVWIRITGFGVSSQELWYRNTQWTCYQSIHGILENYSSGACLLSFTQRFSVKYSLCSTFSLWVSNLILNLRVIFVSRNDLIQCELRCVSWSRFGRTHSAMNPTTGSSSTCSTWWRTKVCSSTYSIVEDVEDLYQMQWDVSFRCAMFKAWFIVVTDMSN